ncbi:hypothetical protein D9M69_676740 [compost metagenome]
MRVPVMNSKPQNATRRAMRTSPVCSAPAGWGNTTMTTTRLKSTESMSALA